MKFNQCILIAIVILLCISFSVQNASRSKSKAKRRQSMMDYMNDFFSEDSGNNKNQKNLNRKYFTVNMKCHFTIIFLCVIGEFTFKYSLFNPSSK